MNEYVDTNGTKTWFKNGPAIEWANGDKAWLQHGLLHRDDGPAIVHSGDKKEWWLNDKKYSKDEFIFLQFTKGIIINE